MRTLLLVVAVFGVACAREAAPAHVGPPLGDTHLSMGPQDPSVPNPDAGPPSVVGGEVTMPTGPAPTTPAPTNQSNVPAPAPEAQPGVFSPPPAPEGTPGTPVTQPTDVKDAPEPRDTQR
jgi:hypothetical protein